MTAREIIQTITEQIVLPDPDGWDRILRKTDNILMIEWQINLDTELTEA